MPDDRFADLDARTRAGERLADLDEREPAPPEPPRRRPSYMWVVGVAAVILIAVVSLNTLDDPGEAARGPAVGEPMPRFAAPSARGPLDGDANVNQSGSDPAPGDTPACEVRLEGAIRSCDLDARPLVLTFIVPTAACAEFVDRVERLRPRFDGVNFVTVVSAPKERAVELVDEHGWEQPVVVDRNGVLLTRYRLNLCPNVVLVGKGGVVRDVKTADEEWTDAQLAAAVRRLGRG